MPNEQETFHRLQDSISKKQRSFQVFNQTKKFIPVMAILLIFVGGYWMVNQAVTSEQGVLSFWSNQGDSGIVTGDPDNERDDSNAPHKNDTVDLNDNNWRTPGNDSSKRVEPHHEAWAEWTSENAVPVDINHPHFLHSTLEDKRIVMLGESLNQVSDYIEAKVNIVKYLHEELGYNVITFEGNMTEPLAAQLKSEISSPEDHLLMAVSEVWHLEEMVPLFEYIQQTQQTERPLVVTGIGIMPNSSNQEDYHSYFSEWVSQVDATYGEKIAKMEQEYAKHVQFGFREHRPRDYEAELIADYEDLLQFLKVNEAKLQTTTDDAHLYEMTKYIINDRIHTLSSILTIEDYDERISSQGELQARHLTFLAEDIYPDEKIIVWGFNATIRKDRLDFVESGQQKSIQYMGALLPQTLKNQSYALAFYFNEASLTFPNGQLEVTTDQHRVESIEWILSHAAHDVSFLDISRQTVETGNQWLYEPIKPFGTSHTIYHDRLVLDDQFDGVLFFQKVSTATPLQ